MKKILLFSMICLMALMVNAQKYVDLGLPSGTLWKDKNEEGGLYAYDKAKSKFSDKLPSKEQFEELMKSCRWTWTGSGYKIVGPNGNSIFLPYTIQGKTPLGLYWTLRSCKSFYFSSNDDKEMGRYSYGAVRFVQGKILSDSIYIEQLIAEV